MKNDHLWSFFNIIYTFFLSLLESCYIQNRVIMNRVIKRLKLAMSRKKSPWSERYQSHCCLQTCSRNLEELQTKHACEVKIGYCACAAIENTNKKTIRSFFFMFRLASHRYLSEICTCCCCCCCCYCCCVCVCVCVCVLLIMHNWSPVCYVIFLFKSVSYICFVHSEASIKNWKKHKPSCSWSSLHFTVAPAKIPSDLILLLIALFGTVTLKQKKKKNKKTCKYILVEKSK